MNRLKEIFDGLRRCQLFGHDLRVLVRWFIVALSSIVFGLGILYGLIDGLGLPVWLGSLLCAEIGTLLRFFLNERFVFQTSGSIWLRLIKYHVANGGGYLIWYGTTNAIALLGIHYLLGGLLGMAASMVWSLITNFGWVWRAPTAKNLTPPLQAGSDAGCP